MYTADKVKKKIFSLIKVRKQIHNVHKAGPTF